MLSTTDMTSCTSCKRKKKTVEEEEEEEQEKKEEEVKEEEEVESKKTSRNKRSKPSNTKCPERRNSAHRTDKEKSTAQDRYPYMTIPMFGITPGVAVTPLPACA